MSRRRGNWGYNYPLVIEFLKKNGYEYAEFNDGQHIKILTPTQQIEVWPSRMTYHIIESETQPTSKRWPRLNIVFDREAFRKLLEQ